MAEDATAVAVTDEDRELATKPVHGLFVKYSLITLIGMAAQAVMVILEGVIIGNGLGSFGLAVVGIIMPLELLNLALGGSLGMGVATVAGNRLGAGDMAGARKAFGQGFGPRQRGAQHQCGRAGGFEGATGFHQHLIGRVADVQVWLHSAVSSVSSTSTGGKWMWPQPADHSGRVRSVLVTSKANS